MGKTADHHNVRPMTNTKLKFGFVSAIVAASVATPMVIQHFSQVKLREMNEALRQQADQLVQSTVEHDRFSNLVVQTQGTTLSETELSELLRLRGEIRQLRQAMMEIDRLRVKNKQLLAACARAEAESRLPSPDPRTILAYWPKNQLTFAGYVDPASALKTALWAMSLGDTTNLVASVTPKAKVEMAKEGWDNRRDPAIEIADTTRKISESLSPSSGYYIVGQKIGSQEQAILDVYFEGEGKTRKFEMKKIGGEWKFNAMGLAGGNDDDLQYGGSGWP
jgi:hypothetical protein